MNEMIKDYLKYKQTKISNRYITLKDITPLIKDASNDFKIREFGKSYLNNSIYKIKIGTGKKKIIIWSQMHGNESTGTKAIFDLLNFLKTPLEKKTLRNSILKECTIHIIPMLNPDGAEKYTRVNAQNIDLNRDIIALNAPESKLLNDFVFKVKPHFCFNLHDQRPIFSVGKDHNPATISFLAPSVDIERTITKSRISTMEIIVAMHRALKCYIPNQIGRYTDEFYPTATGDNFQKAGFNTILIEAGHFKGDYTREETRKFNFIALLEGLTQIAIPQEIDHTDYFKIPNNEKKYFDSIYTNVIIDGKKNIFGVYFTELLVNKKITYLPTCNILEDVKLYGADNNVRNKYFFDSLNDFKQCLLKANKS